MKEEEKNLVRFNASDGCVVCRGPMTRSQGLEIIRLVRQVLKHERVNVTTRGESIKPQDLVLELIDADSEVGRRLTPAATPKAKIAERH